MKYLIVGAGGAGGCLAAFMTEGGLDVAVVDRGEHLEDIKRKGITLETEFRGTYTVAPVRAFSTDEYNEEPDVIILCVKEYSARDVLPFIRRIARPGVILIPVISVFDMGIRLQTSLKELNVMDGCIYVAAVITEPGTINPLAGQDRLRPADVRHRGHRLRRHHAGDDEKVFLHLPPGVHHVLFRLHGWRDPAAREGARPLYRAGERGGAAERGDEHPSPLRHRGDESLDPVGAGQ